MIIIKAPTAQTASDTLNLDTPPVLTIGAEYGGFVCRGSKYTSAYSQPKGSEFYEHPLPKNDLNIPIVKDNEVILIKEINPQTVAGVLRAMGLKEDYFSEKYLESFWGNLNFTHSKEIDLRVKRVVEFIEEKRLGSSHYIYNTDVTEDVISCINYLLEEIKKEPVMVKNDKNLETWVTSTPYNIVVRKSFSEDTSNMFTDPTGHTNEVCVSYLEKKGKVIISSRDPKINCREFSISKWGMTWGFSQKSGSPDLRAITKEEFSEIIADITSYVREKTYRL